MDDNKKFWDRVAKLYAPIQERSNSALYAAVEECCKPYLNENARVLELACGTGQLTAPLCPLAGDWTATDFSEKMIHEARRRCPEQVHFSVADATALPYDRCSFDVALIANALHIMPTPEKALAEIWRVLKDDGILLAPTFVYEGKFNRFRMWITTKVGFKTYYHWNLMQTTEALEQAGFQLLEQKLLPGDPIPEGFFALRKITAK